MSTKRFLTKDEQLTVLADCQKILRDPERAQDLVRYVALFFNPQPAEIPQEIARLKSVQRAQKLGIGIRFVKDAPAHGEIRANVYEHVFVYPLYKRKSDRWAAPFGRSLSAAIDGFVGASSKELSKRHYNEDEDDADWWKKGASC